MKLVDRDNELGELDSALNAAAAGTGCVVVIAGEAGAGKTALIRQFASQSHGRSRFLWGMCDELITPRPLGPFRDITGQLGRPPSAEVHGPAMIDSLAADLRRRSRPTVVVIEDVHWADAATLDAVRYLGRRIGQLSALLVMTFRDDEVRPDHPLRAAIAAVPRGDLHRIELEPLSYDAVALLAGHHDVDEIYQLTGGNPFFVSEVLGARNAAVPVTVQDAVMARVGQLCERARACVEFVSVVPGRAERSLVEACGVADGIEEAKRCGVLRVEQDFVSFTHELARRAVERILLPSRREALNRCVLDVLTGNQEDPARLVHHAAEARDRAAVVRFAPSAARHAASLDAHRESVAHFRRALEYPESYSAAELAALRYEFARECSLTERHEEAERALDGAIDLHTKLGAQEALGADLTMLSDVQWNLRRGKEVAETSMRAIDVLTPLPASGALAAAYAQRAKISLLDRRSDDAIAWGEKAIMLAKQLGDTAAWVRALNTVGTAKWINPPFDNRALLESLDLARSNGLAAEVGRAYANLAVGFLERREYEQAKGYIDEGLAFCDVHDLLVSHRMLLGHRANWNSLQGRWGEAEADARRLLAEGGGRRLPALQLLVQIQIHQGSSEAAATLDKAARLAERSGVAQDLLPVGLNRLEFAWLNGVFPNEAELAEEMFALALRTKVPRCIGEAGLWLHRLGALTDIPNEAERPYALQINGQWREAADAWDKIGQPYKKADALGEADEPGPLLEAIAILDRLGARPRAAMVRRRLAEMGVTSVPRGPRDSTRANVAGLTTRQVDVLKLLAESLTYQEIAQRLHVSTKTVDHHAAAARAKLGVTTSVAAVAEARKLGILHSSARAIGGLDHSVS